MKGNREKDERKLPSECTTIIVGEKQSADGARYLCRSSDFDALMAVNVEVHHDTDNGPEEWQRIASSDVHCHERLWDIPHCLTIPSRESGAVPDITQPEWA